MLFQGIKQHTEPAYYNFNLIFSELIIRHQTTARISENTKQDKYNTHTHTHTQTYILTPWHITLKLLQTRDKKKIWKTGRGKNTRDTERNKNKNENSFLAETIEAQIQRNDIFKTMKRNFFQPNSILIKCMVRKVKEK